MRDIESFRQLLSFCLAAGMLLAGLLLGCGDDDSVGPGKPVKIVAINGLHYKGEMGSDTVDKPLQFAVADKNDNYLPNQQIQLEQLEGDGNLDPKSIVTDSTGIAGFTYNFDGALGHTRIRLVAPDIDSLDILIRANTLIPGVAGQGQYVLLTDTYAEVKAFNGEPQSIDILDPDYWLVVANYENSLGLAVLIEDASHNQTADNFEAVLAIALSKAYDGTTQSSPPIGIGSSLSDVRTVFGDPDLISLDSDEEGPFLRVCFDNLDTEFIGALDSDTTITEIDLYDIKGCP